MIPQSVRDGLTEVAFDFDALHGRIAFNDKSRESWRAVAFWMHYAWSAFCLQWVAISWCAAVGKEQP